MRPVKVPASDRAGRVAADALGRLRNPEERLPIQGEPNRARDIDEDTVSAFRQGCGGYITGSGRDRSRGGVPGSHRVEGRKGQHPPTAIRLDQTHGSHMAGFIGAIGIDVLQDSNDGDEEPHTLPEQGQDRITAALPQRRDQPGVSRTLVPGKLCGRVDAATGPLDGRHSLLAWMAVTRMPRAPSS